MNTQVLSHPDRRKGERRHAPAHAEHGRQHEHSMPMPMARYGRFWAMVATSTVIGWAAMYLNTYQLDHVFFSWTRVFMAMIMGGVMTAVMMAFMWGMYPDRRSNLAVLGVAAALFVAGLALVRSQATVGDVAYMRAMIPHHSIAILTSSRAKIEDPRVRKLADGIIETQKREIAEMKQLIADLDK
jgi:peptidoglycan/LPS O-acetylase OafA/YrhL